MAKGLGQPQRRPRLTGLVVALGMLAWVTSSRAAALGSAADPLSAPWQPASEPDQALIWRIILQSPLGIAALNQLAIEGFISPQCEQKLYTHATYETFQTLLQVQCPTPLGVSAARAYAEMRLLLNRFEDTITDFSVERIYGD
ncbi:MAG TPA: hypothetical protein IGR64_10405 [Leptolyngbyaceae cyanobacterium M65_K2018_010]|nr:hypothetical protein [Leptolyngbyaceae cyanobacterium M65_K2018_010]